MTVESTTTYVVAAGNDTARVFSFSPIQIYEDTDLQVYLIDADNNATLLTQGVGSSNYIVNSQDYPATGSITYPADGVSAPLAGGTSLLMTLALSIEQPTHLENQGGYLPEVQEAMADRATSVSLMLNALITRCVKGPVWPIGTVSYDLPAPEAGYSLAWNDDGTAIVNVPAGLQGPAGPTGPQGPQGPSGSGSGDMVAANNLSELTNKATARSNLGVAIGSNDSGVLDLAVLVQNKMHGGAARIKEIAMEQSIALTAFTDRRAHLLRIASLCGFQGIHRVLGSAVADAPPHLHCALLGCECVRVWRCR
mgnify:CR=1 FL=1